MVYLLFEIILLYTIFGQNASAHSGMGKKMRKFAIIP